MCSTYWVYFWGVGLGCCSFTRCLLASRLDLNSYAIGTRWTHTLLMQLLFASSRINITILDEQLEGLHVVAFLKGSEWNHLYTIDNFRWRRKVYSVTRCQQKIILKNIFSMFTLLRAIHFSIANELEDYVVPKCSLWLVYVWFLNNL